MEAEELRFLTEPATRQWIEAHMGENPADLGLKYAKSPLIWRSAIRQVALLQKARQKLPAWYAARCIFTPRTYEQASGEAAANLKFFRGARCLDLTLGLGVDAWRFASLCDQVVALDPDPAVCRLARYNFARLGIANVEIVEQDAAGFLAAYTGPPFDLVYADPDRREAHRRKIGLADGSPDMPALLPRIESLARSWWIKASPLLDLAEAERIFPKANRFAVVSVKGECKEVWIQRLENAPAKRKFTVLVARAGTVRSFDFTEPPARLAATAAFDPAYIWEPDAAFYHARRTLDLALRYPPAQLWPLAPDGYFFSLQPAPPDFPGRCFHVLEIFPYQPQKLRKALRIRGIDRIQFTQRKFPHSAAQIRKETGMPDGGDHLLVCTVVEGRKMAYLTQLLPASELGSDEV